MFCTWSRTVVAKMMFLIDVDVIVWRERGTRGSPVDAILCMTGSR